MAGFYDIDGALIMCGSPGIIDCAYLEIKARELWEPSPLRRLAALDFACAPDEVELAGKVLGLIEAGDWDTALSLVAGRWHS